MAGARELKQPASAKKKLYIALGAAAGAALGAYLGLCAWVGGAGMMPNLTLGGLDVAGMTVDQAQAVVDQAVETHAAKASVTLTYGDWSGTITGDQLQSFGQDSALHAWRVGRKHFLTQGYEYIRHAMRGDRSRYDVVLSLGYDGVVQQPLEQLLDEAERAIGCAVGCASYEIQDDRLVMTKGKTGLALDREAAKIQVYNAFNQDTLPDAFRGEQSNYTVEMFLIETAPAIPDFDAIQRELCAQPQNAAVDPETYGIIDHVVGVDFRAADLRAAYEAAGEGETFSIPVTITMPEETRQSLEKKLFAHVLGEAVTRVGGTANRKTNVKLSAEACNNVILMPGEEFSYNNSTGSRSEDKGYLPAPVYSGGASVDETGGGICQTSSTIYYAVLHSTLEIVERHAHMYATGYVPDGMDATVYFGALDFRFKNNTNYPVKLVTESYDKNGSRYLKAKLYGTNESGRYAVPEREQFEWVEPTIKYVEDETVPQGTTKVDEKQNPYTGRKAQCYRYIYEADGTLVEKENMGVSKYKMRPKTVYYNPLDGDPAAWVDGQPPKPTAAVEPTPAPEVELVPPAVPEPQPVEPEAPAIQPENIQQSGQTDLLEGLDPVEPETPADEAQQAEVN